MDTHWASPSVLGITPFQGFDYIIDRPEIGLHKVV